MPRPPEQNHPEHDRGGEAGEDQGHGDRKTVGDTVPVGAAAFVDAPPGPIAESGADSSTKRKLHMEILLFFVVVAGRCAYSFRHSTFRLFPDEPGTLAMARWLSGNGGWDMAQSLTWKPGMATLVAPLFWLTGDQQTIVQAGHLIGAIAGGVAAVLMGRLVVRLTGMSSTQAIRIAALKALGPRGMSTSNYVWGEPLVTVTFLATLLALLRFFDTPSLSRAAVAISSAASGYLAHSRMLPLVITAILLTAGRLASLARWRATITTVAIGGASIAAIDAYSSLFYAALWTDPRDTNTVSAVAARLADPLGILLAGAGQLWYLLASTAGIFGLGSYVLVARSVRGDDPRIVRDARLVIAATLPLIGLSVMFMSDRPRVDQQIYGRYNDAIVWPVLAVGVAWVLGVVGPSAWRAGKPRLIVFGSIGVLIVETMMLSGYALRQPSLSGELVAQMIPGVAGFLTDPDNIDVLIISAIALAGLVAIAVGSEVARKHRMLALAVGAIALLALDIRAYQFLEEGQDFAIESAAVRELVGPVLSAGDEVVFGYVPAELQPGVNLYLQGYYAQFYQWYLPEIDFRIIADGVYPADGHAFAPIHDRVLVNRGACIVWRDPVVGIVLWDTRPDRCKPGGDEPLASP